MASAAGGAGASSSENPVADYGAYLTTLYISSEYHLNIMKLLRNIKDIYRILVEQDLLTQEPEFNNDLYGRVVYELSLLRKDHRLFHFHHAVGMLYSFIKDKLIEPGDKYTIIPIIEDELHKYLASYGYTYKNGSTPPRSSLDEYDIKYNVYLNVPYNSNPDEDDVNNLNKYLFDRLIEYGAINQQPNKGFVIHTSVEAARTLYARVLYELKLFQYDNEIGHLHNATGIIYAFVKNKKMKTDSDDEIINIIKSGLRMYLRYSGPEGPAKRVNNISKAMGNSKLPQNVIRKIAEDAQQMKGGRRRTQRRRKTRSTRRRVVRHRR